MEKHTALIVMASRAAAALVTTAAGILVAIPGRWSYNHLCSRVEDFASLIRRIPSCHTQQAEVS